MTLETRSGRKSEEAYSRVCAWVGDQRREGGPRFTRAQWLRRRGADRVVVHHDREPVEQESEVAVVWVKDDSLFGGLVACTPREHDALHS